MSSTTATNASIVGMFVAVVDVFRAYITYHKQHTFLRLQITLMCPGD